MATFCLLHGAWHDPSCWEPLIGCLRARGHEAVAPDLPFHDPNAGFEERVSPARQVLEDVEGPVIVVGHSLGSGYAPLVAFRNGFPFPPERPDGTSVWDAGTAIDVLYPRLPPATARALAHHLRPLAADPGEYPLPGHPDIPTVLVYAADDEVFEPAWERFMATELLGIEPIEIPGGHFPMLEDPDGLADLLDRLALRHATSG